MRILLYCDEDLGVAAGGSRQVLELATALGRRHHAVRIVAPEPLNAPVGLDHASVTLKGIPVVRRGGVRPLSYLLASARALSSIMSSWQPDVLLWFDSPGQVAPLAALQGSTCKVIYFVNGLPEQEVRGLWRWQPLRKALTYALHAAARRADVVVGVCPELVEKLQAQLPVPLSGRAVIRNGVDAARFVPRPPVDARHQLGLPGGGPYIGFVGGFFPWHGLETLIEAMPMVAKVYPTAQLLMVGDGQTRGAMEALCRLRGIEGHVRFVGRAEFALVPAWIAACDVCVVLHRALRSYPGDSMKLWEYLACGRPVIATAGPGYGETVEALGAGVAVQPDDPADLAAQLVRLLEDDDLRRTMGERGRIAVEQWHTWDARAQELEALCAPLLRTERQAA